MDASSGGGTAEEMDNIKDWVSLPMPQMLSMASCTKDWERINAESSVMLSPSDPVGQGVGIEIVHIFTRGGDGG